MITPGKWCVQHSDHGGGLLIKPIPGPVIAQCDEIPEMEDNACLIAEAGTVAHETGLSPRQLADQRAVLLDALKFAQTMMSDNGLSSSVVDKALAKAEGRT